MKKIKLLFASLAFVVLGATAVLVPNTPVGAVNALESACDASNAADNPVCSSDEESVPALIKTLINVLLFIVGALAVIMLIWGGIRYTTSAGNAASVTAAKNIIMYSIVGLVVAFIAYAVVNWVLAIFK